MPMGEMASRRGEACRWKRQRDVTHRRFTTHKGGETRTLRTSVIIGGTGVRSAKVADDIGDLEFVGDARDKTRTSEGRRPTSLPEGVDDAMSVGCNQPLWD